jgi:enoyl-CoA hydratase/carnithine racemase
MGMALTGRTLSAREAKEYGFVNEISPSKVGIPVVCSRLPHSSLHTTAQADALKTAIAYAKLILRASPDAVALTKQAIMEALQEGEEKATASLIHSPEFAALGAGENFAEGVKAFAEKRAPRWKSRL